MAEEQSKICAYFQTVQCEDDQHEECAEEYEGKGIKALCICNCHKEIVSVSGKRSNRHKIAGRQSNLEEFQAD